MISMDVEIVGATVEIGPNLLAIGLAGISLIGNVVQLFVHGRTRRQVDGLETVVARRRAGDDGDQDVTNVT